jgi:hypothetical protein
VQDLLLLPIDKCMTTLRLLISEANPNGIALAERAIDQLIAAQDGPPRQVRALHMLEEMLAPMWKSATGKQLNFVNVLFDYVATCRKTLTPPKPGKRLGGDQNNRTSHSVALPLIVVRRIAQSKKRH